MIDLLLYCTCSVALAVLFSAIDLFIPGEYYTSNGIMIERYIPKSRAALGLYLLALLMPALNNVLCLLLMYCWLEEGFYHIFKRK